ncbi:histidine protein methyltransferase 1 [Echinococcus multilocularis]|uniref:protein-histidine N-methyltransferase n=1 Tax=Echinococcus multilocularis TaxID=6211 RepID=A0A068Y512_ECHMU|nr:histidine protein methyltransferase 1 [Echinococcus multilocularis]
MLQIAFKYSPLFHLGSIDLGPKPRRSQTTTTYFFTLLRLLLYHESLLVAIAEVLQILMRTDFKFGFFKSSEPQVDPNLGISCKSDKVQSLPKQYTSSDAWRKTFELPVRPYKYAVNKAIRIYQEDAVEECVKVWNLCADEDQGVLKALSSGCDVVAGVVEGGFTVWMGTRFLLNFLVDKAVDFAGKRVLDLGCGAGVLGIYALLHCAASVTFQDFNHCVIKAWTVPNVRLQSTVEEQHADFWAGDWEDLADVWRLQGKQFDMILTAETIYRRDLYSKLLTVLEAVSAPECCVYLVSKLAYHGNDGSLESFCDFIHRTCVFTCKKVQLESGNTCYGCLVMTKIKTHEQ